jgi:hypothetical protein
MLQETRHGEFAAASRLCKELTERGGLYSSFAAFLRWRADILPRGWVPGFQQAREAAPASRTETAALLGQELGARGDKLAAHLDPEPCWSTRARCAFRSRFDGRSVVVECAREPVTESEFRVFERELSRLRDAAALVISSDTLEQFREWSALADGLARERAYLEAAGEFREHTSFLFPEIVSGLCSSRVLCFTWIEGSPAYSRIGAGDAKAASKLAELILEQACMLGMIDADLDVENIVITDGGRLALRRWNRFVAVPLGLRPAVVRYLCGVMSGESSRAARMLVRLALRHDSNTGTARVRKALAGVEPELKGELRFPISATMFESYWRAVSSTRTSPPLYLDCLHRNLHAIGYCCAAAADEAIGLDPLVEAQFAVLGRLIRRRGTDLLESDPASGWALGSAMLPLKALRYAVRLGERFVDNDSESGFPSRAAADREEETRRIRSLVGAGLLVAAFLVCVHVGNAEPEPWQAWIPVAAAAVFASLVGVVVRLD